MRRFFIDSSAIKDSKLKMTGPEAHHLTNVLRLKAGTTVCLYDGTGNIYHANIISMDNRQVDLDITQHNQETASGPALFLGQGLATGKKMDLIIQKTTELGISGIIPFISCHSSVRRQAAGKIERWQKIALAACKQCGRATPPQISEPVNLLDLLDDNRDYTDKIIFWENEEQAVLNEITQNNSKFGDDSKLLFIIGPEGGFSSQEIEHAQQAGFVSATLGQRILRTETAAISATAILQYLCGNLI